MRENAQPLVVYAGALSLRDRAYVEIKRRINRMDYRPGAYLNEAQISRQLGIGRTPVHQALDRLMLEGLLQVIPRKGVVVQSISLDEVLHILDMRLVNEPYCVGLAAERATSQDIMTMRELLGSAGPLIRARDREKLMNLDRAFHHRISLAAHNPILADMLTMLHERSLRFGSFRLVATCNCAGSTRSIAISSTPWRGAIAMRQSKRCARISNHRAVTLCERSNTKAASGDNLFSVTQCRRAERLKVTALSQGHSCKPQRQQILQCEAGD